MEQQENRIVLFANQKGGVGKTTLCGLFANYLSVEKEVPLLVIDADPQQTFSGRRKDDLRRQTCRVNQQVQNYKTCLKNSRFGVEKFNFSLGLSFNFFCIDIILLSV